MGRDKANRAYFICCLCTVCLFSAIFGVDCYIAGLMLVRITCLYIPVHDIVLSHILHSQSSIMCDCFMSSIIILLPFTKFVYLYLQFDSASSIHTIGRSFDFQYFLKFNFRALSEISKTAF